MYIGLGWGLEPRASNASWIKFWNDCIIVLMIVDYLSQKKGS